RGGLSGSSETRRDSRVAAYHRIRVGSWNVDSLSEEVFTQGEAISISDANCLWNTLARIIKDAEKEILGVAIGTSKTHTARRESWWQSEEVQSKVAKKQARFKELIRSGRIKQRWGEYFSSLFNAREPEGRQKEVNPSILPQLDCYYSRISRAEVKTSLQKMGSNKAAGPDQIPIEAWRGLRDEGLSWLTNLFNKISISAKMPEEWRLKSMEGLNNILENLKEALEDNDLRISRENTKYLRCDFGRVENTYNEVVDICIGDNILHSNESFRYLDRWCTNLRGLTKTCPITLKQPGQSEGRPHEFFVIENVPLKLKGKFYRVVIRPGLLYGSQCWPITKALANRVEVAELRMLRWTCGKSMLDMIPNEVYRAKLEVETIINKMRKGRLRWFRH
nr:hypothetical protein [Tanacetum cinerariifolium]